MKRNKHSPGFSLILSLTVMAGLIMLIVTVSAFITIESRAAMNQQLATRARLNGIVAMRLALAHLQQEAGADRRATARAEIIQPAASPAATSSSSASSRTRAFHYAWFQKSPAHPSALSR